MATAPDTEFEPGRLTPPPAVIAKFAAVKTAPGDASTLPGVISRTNPTFELEKLMLCEIEMLPEVEDPILSAAVVIWFSSAGSKESLPAELLPRSSARPADIG